jgi:hypothetical protein
MLRADPVIKAAMAVKEMNSTIHPNRVRPRKVTMDPAMTAKADAMTCPGTFGSVFADFATTFPVTVDNTATG